MEHFIDDGCRTESMGVGLLPLLIKGVAEESIIIMIMRSGREETEHFI